MSHLARYSAQSTLTNKSRLKLLQQREEHLQDLFDTARASIADLAADESRYAQFLESVIVQGYLSLLESEVTIHVREKDVDLAKSAADNAAKQYHEISGRTVHPTVQGTLSNDLYVSNACDYVSFLSIQSSAGGVKLISGNSRITIDNTLDERLRLLEDRVRLERLRILCVIDDGTYRCCQKSGSISSEPILTASSSHRQLDDMFRTDKIPQHVNELDSLYNIRITLAQFTPHVSPTNNGIGNDQKVIRKHRDAHSVPSCRI